ncbi:MAG TPA: ABC transporter permease subunit [Nitrososphaerales archaeon]|nr:ABC transporter permease subunit [Nitrososphaerales archaeon]
MRLSKSWIIAAKDFKTYRKKKNIIYALMVIPFLVAILITGIISYVGQRNAGRVSPAELVVLLPAFGFFYVILAAYLATPIASYTIVGEKVEKSLEPLLATPTTDSEILLGKGIAAFFPPLFALWGGSAVFMVLMDLTTKSKLGYYYFPDWNTALVLFLLLPLALLMSVLVNVIISSRVTDIRTGQQLGGLAVLPFAGLYVCGELNIVNLGDTGNLLLIVAALIVVDLLLFVVSRATFRREEILTRWK